MIHKQYNIKYILLQMIYDFFSFLGKIYTERAKKNKIWEAK